MSGLVWSALPNRKTHKVISLLAKVSIIFITVSSQCELLMYWRVLTSSELQLKCLSEPKRLLMNSVRFTVPFSVWFVIGINHPTISRRASITR